LFGQIGDKGSSELFGGIGSGLGFGSSGICRLFSSSVGFLFVGSSLEECFAGSKLSLVGSSSVTDPFTPELDLSEAEVVTIVLARVRSRAGACLFRTAVISALRTGLGTVEVHQAIADRSSLVLARLSTSSITAAGCESSSATGCSNTS